jgi:stage V sporulation protein AA
MNIYIKAQKRVTVAGKDKLTLGDIAEVSAPKEIEDKLRGLTLMTFPKGGDTAFEVSAIDIVDAVSKVYPGRDVECVGEADTLVEFRTEKPKKKPFSEFLRVAAVSIIIFMGASTAIMSFHSDAQIPEVFKTYYKIFTGKEEERPLIIEVPYSIGLTAGIIIFFNHFGGRKLSDDPTPIEVEIELYERDVADTKLAELHKKSKKGNKRE